MTLGWKDFCELPLTIKKFKNNRYTKKKKYARELKHNNISLVNKKVVMGLKNKNSKLLRFTRRLQVVD